jgi:hypothetical protein
MPAVSEKPLVKNLDEVLAQIKTSTDPNELAALMVLASELYSQGQCVCEVRPDGSDDNIMCWKSINTERDKMLNTFLTALRNVRGG